MQLEDCFDFIADNDIRVKGTRIGIETILYEYIYGSQTPEAIAARYPTLSLKQVYATITYYLHNRDSIRRYLEEWVEHGRRMRDEQSRQPSAAVTRLQQIKSERQSVAAAGNSN